MSTLYLCGAGNPEGVRLALRVNEATRRWSELVLLDDDAAKHGRAQLGVRVAGGFDRLGANRVGADAINLVARTCVGRRVAAERIARFGATLKGLVAPDVDLLGARVADDLIAYQNATIGPEVEIDEGCVVFMGAAVGHESRVGRNCVIAANAVLNARVILGDGVYIGSNAALLPEVTIGAGAVIGAGATVIDDVPAGATVVGAVGAVAQTAEDGHAGRSGTTDGVAEVERQLTSIWNEMLGVSALQPDRNFFDVGGTSLLALRMLQRVEQNFGVRATLLDFFEFPTIRSFSGWVTSKRNPSSRGDAGRVRLERRREALERLHGPVA